MRKLAPVVLIVVAGCSVMRTAETPAQRFYAAQGSYNIVAAVALAYMQTETADEKVKGVIKAIDNRVYTAVQHGSEVMVATRGKTRETQLQIYSALILAGADQLKAYLITQEVLTP